MLQPEQAELSLQQWLETRGGVRQRLAAEQEVENKQQEGHM